MAKIIRDNGAYLLVFTRHETVQLIALLSAQLGDTNVEGHQVGASPGFNFEDGGQYQINNHY